MTTSKILGFVGTVLTVVLILWIWRKTPLNNWITI